MLGDDGPDGEAHRDYNQKDHERVVIMSRRRAQREEAKANFLEENPHLPHHETTVEVEATPGAEYPFAVNFQQDSGEGGEAELYFPFNNNEVFVDPLSIVGPHFELAASSREGFIVSRDGISVLNDDFASTLTIDFVTSDDEYLALDLFDQNPFFARSLPSPTPVEPKGGKSVEFDVQATGAGGVTVTLLDDDDTILIERKFLTSTDAEQQFSAEVELPQGVFFDEARIQAIGETEFTVTGLSFATNYEPGFDPMPIA